jgi:hypothetical protein
MSSSLELARKARSIIFTDLVTRAERSDAVGRALDQSSNQLPGSEVRTHWDNAKLALGDALNVAMMIPDVLGIALIDTFTLPMRRKQNFQV